VSAPSASLRELFLAKYQDFRKRLRIRLGSEDLANEAMQETWLRVESMPDAAPVEYPAAYLFKIAVNVAEDQRRGSARLLSMEELEELYELADEAAGPVREVEGRQQLAALEAALAELPRRRQAIVIAARVDEVPHREIAERFGISVRTVEKELRAGLEHCCRKLEKEYVQRFGPGAGKSS
jgi:RNA polymerase sigma-70 factor (ECF subfamily)